MVWNNRVVKREWKRADGSMEICYQIHEVFYDKKGAKPDMVSSDATAALGETLHELREDLERMLKAVNGVIDKDHDVLNYEDF